MALPSGDSANTRSVTTKTTAYGMSVNDAATGVHPAETAQNSGLVSMSDLNITERPVTELATFAAGERNESLPGGFKLTQ